MSRLAITVNKSKISFKNILWILSLALFFAVNMNQDWRTNPVLWYIALVFIFGAYFATFDGKFPFKDLSFFYWSLSFVGLGILSLTWSISANSGMDVIKTIVVNIAVLFLIHSSVKLDFTIRQVLEIYFFATLINTVYVLATVDMEQLGQVQLGTELIEGWNGNIIGYMTAQGALIGLYLMNTTQRKRAKLFYLICIGSLCVITMYTGSRTSFIMLTMELILYFCLCKPAKMIRNAIISAGILVLAAYLVMHVESFYEVLGKRLEGLFALLTGEGEVDASANLRDIFIKNGKQWFSENPIFGYGLNNYMVLNQTATGRTTYAHNNFIEIAVDLGAVGLVLYYSAYAYLIWKLFKIVKKDRFYAYLLSALIAALVMQYGSVCYYGFYHNFLIMLCFLAVNAGKKEKTARQPLG